MMTPEISRWVASWPVPSTHEMAATRIEAARRLARAGEALPLGVVERASGGLIGWVGFRRDRDERRRGSFGCWLGKEHQGKGCMRELAPVALSAAFEPLDLDVIEAAAQPANAASFAVMLACGMHPVGEGMVYAPARERDELCRFYEVLRRPLMA